MFSFFSPFSPIGGISIIHVRLSRYSLTTLHKERLNCRPPRCARNPGRAAHHHFQHQSVHFISLHSVRDVVHRWKKRIKDETIQDISMKTDVEIPQWCSLIADTEMRLRHLLITYACLSFGVPLTIRPQPSIPTGIHFSSLPCLYQPVVLLHLFRWLCCILAFISQTCFNWSFQLQIAKILTSTFFFSFFLYSLTLA